MKYIHYCEQDAPVIEMAASSPGFVLRQSMLHKNSAMSVINVGAVFAFTFAVLKAE